MTISRPSDSGGWRFNTIGALLAASVVILAAVLAFYAGGQRTVVLAVILFEGGAAALWFVSATLLGSVVLRALTSDAHGLLKLVTSAGLGLGLFSLAMLGLSLAGLASRGSVIALMAVGAGVGLVNVLIKHRDALREPMLPKLGALLSWPVTWPWLWLAAMPFLAIAVLGACLAPGILWWPLDPHPYDVLAYHLQVPREWYELGRMIPLRHNVFSFFPFNAEMHFLTAMYLRGGPWQGMYTAQFMSVGFAVVAVLTVYAGTRTIPNRTLSASPANPGEGWGGRSSITRAASLPRDRTPSLTRPRSAGGGEAGGTVAAVLFAIMPWVVMLSCVAYVESMLLMFAALAAVWGLRALQEGVSDSAARSLVMAGVMSGFAAGTKITAVPMLMLPIAVGVAVARPRLWRGCAALVVAGVVVLSPWLVRNAVWTGGNPLFPLAMKTLGVGHFKTVQVERFRIAHTPPPDQSPPLARLRRLGGEILLHWQFGYVIWGLALVGLVLSWRRPQARACAVTLLFMAIVWIGFTHLIGRFFIVAVPVAALLVAQIPWQRLPAIGGLVVIGAVLLALLPLGRLRGAFEPAALRGREGAFGLPDLSIYYSEELADIERNSPRTVVMVGHAQVFPHAAPMSRIIYRSVFDIVSDEVDTSRADQVLEAWAGVKLDQLPRDAVFYIDPAELKRLSETYYKVPNLPPSILGGREEPFVVPLNSVR